MPSILIIESDLPFAESLKQAFIERQCQVSVLDDGGQAIAAAEQRPPDLIVLSAELPKMSGFSVCNRIKRNKQLAGIPIVIVSSDSSDATFEQHRRLPTKRANDYVHKPIAVSDLLLRIEALIGLNGSPTSMTPSMLPAVAAKAPAPSASEDMPATATPTASDDVAAAPAPPAPDHAPPAPTTGDATNGANGASASAESVAAVPVAAAAEEAKVTTAASGNLTHHDLQQAASRISELKRALQAVQEQEDSVAALGQQLNALQQQLAASQEKEAASANLAARLQEELNQSRADAENLSQDVAAKGQQVKMLGEELERARASLSELEAQSAAQAKQLAQSTQDNDEKQQRIAQLVEQHDNDKQHIDQLSQQSVENQTQLQELTQRNQALDEQLAQLKQAHTQSEQRTAELTEERSALEARLTKLEEEHASLTRTHEETTAHWGQELEAARARLEAEQTKLREQSEENTELKERRWRLENELAAKVKDLDRVEEQLELSQSQAAELLENRDLRNRKLQELQKTLRNATGLVEELVATDVTEAS